MINRIKITLLIIVIGIPNLIPAQKVELTLGTGVSKHNYRQAYIPDWMTYETLKDYYIFSPLIGADFKLNLAKNVDWKVGLNYTSKGSRVYSVGNEASYNQPDTTYHWKRNSIRRAHYFDLPITIHFRKIYTFVGGQISYLWAENGHEQSEYTYFDHGNVFDSETKDHTSSFRTRIYHSRVDFGVILGTEYPINKNFEIALLYYQGFQRIQYIVEYTKCYNSQLLLTLTYCLTNDKVQ